MKWDRFVAYATGLCVILFAIGLYYYVSKAWMVEERLTNLTTWQEQQLQLFQGRISILVTVATLLLGGAGALLLYVVDKGSYSGAQVHWAYTTFLAAGLSIFYGYVTYDAAIWMLNKTFFNLETVAVSVPSKVQFWTLVAAIICLIRCFFSITRSSRR